MLRIDYANGNIAESVALASIVYDILADDFGKSNLHFLSFLTLPNGYSDWEDFYDFCVSKKGGGIRFFKIDTEFGAITLPVDVRVLPHSRAYLFLADLQQTLSHLQRLDLCKADMGELYNICQSLTTTYTLLNSEIGNYHLRMYQESDAYDEHDFWYQKFHPVDWNRQFALQINEMPGYLQFAKDKKALNRPFKLALLEFACQCRYLSFYLCLLTISDAVQLSKRIRRGFYRFMYCLRHSVRSAYIHHVIIEPRDLNTQYDTAARGASDRTTRINVYFTTEDCIPRVARFDLPHKGVGDLHVNVETKTGACENDHCRLLVGDLGWDILKPVEEALQYFTPEDSVTRPLEKDDVEKMLEQIRVERAIFSASAYELGRAVFPEEGEERFLWNDYPKHIQEYLRDCYEIIRKFADCDEDDLSDSDVYQLVADEIFPNL